MWGYYCQVIKVSRCREVGGGDGNGRETLICWGLSRVREKESDRGSVGFQWGTGRHER